MRKEVRGKSWGKVGEDEDEVRLDWQSGKFEKGKMRCETYGDRNAWGKVHRCREKQCDAGAHQAQLVITQQLQYWQQGGQALSRAG